MKFYFGNIYYKYKYENLFILYLFIQYPSLVRPLNCPRLASQKQFFPREYLESCPKMLFSASFFPKNWPKHDF